MFTASCHKCSKRYRLRDQLAGRLPPCPNCGAPLEPDPVPEKTPLRQRLQEELQQLGSARHARRAAPSPGPKLRVAEGAGRARRLLRLLLVVLAAAIVIGGAALGLGRYLGSRTRAPRQMPQEVQKAISDAQHADVPGREAGALAAWQVARRQMVARQESAEEFRAELAACERRIKELEDMLRRRREATASSAEPAPLPPSQPKAAQAPPSATPAAREPSAPPPDLRQIADGVQQRSARGEPVVVVDGPDRYQRWHAEPWANPVALKVEPQTGATEQWIALTQMDGERGKWVASIDQPLDLTAYDSLTLEMQTAEPVSLAVGIWTAPGPALFEGRTQTARKGDRVTLTFPVKGNGFKSEQSRWQFGTAVLNPAGASSVSLFLYSRSNSPIRFRNVTLRKSGATPPPPPSR